MQERILPAFEIYNTFSSPSDSLGLLKYVMYTWNIYFCCNLQPSTDNFKNSTITTKNQSFDMFYLITQGSGKITMEAGVINTSKWYEYTFLANDVNCGDVLLKWNEIIPNFLLHVLLRNLYLLPWHWQSPSSPSISRTDLIGMIPYIFNSNQFFCRQYLQEWYIFLSWLWPIQSALISVSKESPPQMKYGMEQNSVGSVRAVC